MILSSYFLNLFEENWKVKLGMQLRCQCAFVKAWVQVSATDKLYSANTSL